VQGAPATTTSYTYDLAGRLTSDGTTTWGYDQNGNRTSVNGATIATYDAQDRLLTYGAETFTYTAGGDAKTRTGPGGTTTYTYDLRGNLRRVDLPSGDFVEYLIDGANRRVARKLNGTVTHKWLYEDGLRPVAELDGAGALVSLFVYSASNPGGAPDAIIRGGATYRVAKAPLGSPRLIVNQATGAVVQQMNLDAWGNVTLDTNPGLQPFGFAGGLLDQSTVLVRFGVRDLNTYVARWSSKDSVRFRAGLNQYAYVANDPINRIDPSGRYLELPAAGAGLLVIVGGGVIGSGIGLFAFAAPAWECATGNCSSPEPGAPGSGGGNPPPITSQRQIARPFEPVLRFGWRSR
jgi:RHS repeat-associated protein